MSKVLPKSVKNPAGFTLVRSAKVNHRGFTLVELLVVVAIIAILSVIGLTVFTGVQKNARNVRRQADIEAISKALEVHYGDTDCSGVTATLPYCPVTEATKTILFSTGAIPSNPSPGGAAYSGLPTAVTTTYTICATLEPSGTFCRSNQQ